MAHLLRSAGGGRHHADGAEVVPHVEVVGGRVNCAGTRAGLCERDVATFDKQCRQHIVLIYGVAAVVHGRHCRNRGEWRVYSGKAGGLDLVACERERDDAAGLDRAVSHAALYAVSTVQVPDGVAKVERHRV